VIRLALALLVLLSACLERADEETGYSAHVLPKDTRIPDSADDEILTMRIANNAGASGPMVELHTGFAAGIEVQYWDFGPSTSSVEPVWIFERDGEPVDHPPLVDSLPGDDAYTPFRAVYKVEVADSYGGERITSLAALEDAIELGLVREPEGTGQYVSWPILPPDFALERPGQEPLGTRELFCKGHIAHYVPLAEPQPFERSVSASTAYSLRLQHEGAALEEPALGADLNEDGDQLDSNVIFDVGRDPASGLWMPIEITVPSDYVFGAYRATTDLFGENEMGDPVAVPDAFIAQTPGEDSIYRPLYATEAQ
jgi:hypothetical protein